MSTHRSTRRRRGSTSNVRLFCSLAEQPRPPSLGPSPRAVYYAWLLALPAEADIIAEARRAIACLDCGPALNTQRSGDIQELRRLLQKTMQAS